MPPINRIPQSSGFLFQSVLLRLYTDERFLEGFLSDRRRAVKGFSLTGREEQALLALPEKELKDFHHQLRTKRNRIVERIFSRQANRKSVVLLPSYRHGPALFTPALGAHRAVQISPGAYRLLKYLSDAHCTLSLGELWRAYRTIGELHGSARAMFEATRLITSLKLFGAQIRYL